MIQDQLRGALDGIRVKLQAELDAQVAALEEQQAQAIQQARRAAEEEADRKWSTRVDLLQADWASRLRSELAAAEAAADQKAIADAARARVEAERAAEEVLARVQQELDAERRRREDLEGEVRQAREAAEADRQAREHEDRERREAAEAERQTRERADAERQQRDQAEQAERRQREAAAQAEWQQREAAFSAQQADHLRIVADLQGKLAAAEQALATERARASALEIERTGFAEELHAQKAALDSAVESARQLGRELDEELQAQKVSLESALESERQRSRELETERQRNLELSEALKRADATVAAERDTLTAERASLAADRQALAAAREAGERETALAQEQRLLTEVTEARAAERQSQLAVVERVLNATRVISSARSLSDALSALVTTAAAAAPRAAVFVVNGRALQGWKAEGFVDSPAVLAAALSIEDTGPLSEAMATRQPVPATSENAPGFAALSADRAGVAVPILVGGRAVAVLYADDAAPYEPEAPSSWPEEVQILGQHASVCLAHLTAVRTAQAARLQRSPGAPAAAAALAEPLPEEDNGARRYARLLVSEIKLYNETAVRIGREKRDLMSRLGPEIDRARRLYEERVSPSVGARGWYFQQELVQTLADGDPALLGNSA